MKAKISQQQEKRHVSFSDIVLNTTVSSLSRCKQGAVRSALQKLQVQSIPRVLQWYQCYDQIDQGLNIDPSGPSKV
jgi:hypothetical protein